MITTEINVTKLQRFFFFNYVNIYFANLFIILVIDFSNQSTFDTLKIISKYTHYKR